MLLRPNAWKSFDFWPALLALGLLLAGTSSALGESEIFNQKKCVNDFKFAFSKTGKKRVDQMDPTKACERSAKSQINQIKPEEPRPKLKIGDQEEAQVESDKACEAAYEAAKLVYENLLKYRESVCREMLGELNDYPDCLKNKPAATCQDDLQKMTSIVKQSKATMSTAVKNSITFLGKYEKLNQDAMSAYDADKRELKNLRSTPEKLALPSAGPESGVSKAVSASDQGFPTLQEYLDNLEASQVRSRNSVSIITEQENAKKFLQQMEESLKHFDSEQFNDDLQHFQEKISWANDNKNSITNLKNWVPTTTTLAPALLNGNGGGSTSSLTGGGGSGALPAIAAIGAAGVALGATAANKSGGSSTPQGPAASPIQATPAPTDLGSNGSAAPSPTYQPAPVASNNEQNGNEKKAGNGSEGSSGPLAAGGGSLLLPGGANQAQKTDGKKTEATRAPSSSSEEALQSFGGDLKNVPHPASNGSTNSGGNEISNLLGKMKDLFNFDDTTPSDGSNLMAGSGPGGPSGSSAGGGGDSPSDGYYGEDTGGDDYAGGDEAYDESGYPADEEYSSQYGNVDTTLFSRIHDRHLKCLQKGLILVTREELPE